MNKITDRNDLKCSIFYFVSDMISVIDKKLLDMKALENYNIESHHKFLDYFTVNLNSKIEIFCHKNKDVPSIIVNDLIFCMVCLIDEFFISEKLQIIRQLWTAENLEIRMFQSQSGGDKFYKNIITYLKDLSSNNKSLLLIYFLCLKCGFKGNLRGDLSQIKQIESKIYVSINLEQGESFPVIKRNKYIKNLSYFKKFVLIKNANFILINIIIGLLFMISSGIYWKYQTWDLSKYINNLSKKVP